MFHLARRVAGVGECRDRGQKPVTLKTGGIEGGLINVHQSDSLPPTTTMDRLRSSVSRRRGAGEGDGDGDRDRQRQRLQMETEIQMETEEHAE